ncbi:MAG: FAD-dependent oxidoreductase [Salinirussus sp.]
MLDHLLSRGRIGGLELDNRVVMPPMTTRYAPEDGSVTERTRAYYRERARGGTGLIVFESTYPCVEHPRRHQLLEDSYVPGLASVAEAVHDEGGRIAIQLNPHRGYHHEGAPVAPSPMTLDDGTEVPAITQEHISKLVTDFAAGAARAERAGFDGIEIHGTSGYLVNQFLSPLTNQRDDEYGGTLEGRTRFARELLEATRDTVGESFPVWFRLTACEFHDDGLTVDDAAAIAARLEGAGSDAVHLTAGHPSNPHHNYATLSDYDEQGLYADLAAHVREEVTVPVIIVGRISDVEAAEAILAAGKADFVAMGRAHIADPHFVDKAKSGNIDRIRQCVGGMEGCRELVQSGQGVSCTVNPTVGAESQAEQAVEQSKQVAVIGGGPAGLEAARWAAKRGHDVSLYERDADLGGQLRLAANAPAKGAYADLISFFEAELRACGVTIETGHEVSPEDLNVDETVVATGSRAAMPNVRGLSAAAVDDRVVTAREALEMKDSFDGPVAVLGGTEAACDVAEYLAERGHDVSLLATEPLLPLRNTGDKRVPRNYIESRLENNSSIEFVREATVTSIESDSVSVRTPDGSRNYAATTLVIATERAPETFRSTDQPDVTAVIGDAAGPRGLYTAIHEGAEVGRNI